MASGDFIDKRNTFLELLSNFSIESYSEDLKSYYSDLEQYLPDYLYKYCSVSEFLTIIYQILRVIKEKTSSK